jgi:hypothetical protein
MKRATPEMRAVAKALLLDESSRNKSSDAKALAAFHAIEKLRPQLANLMGIGGSQALVSRALVLASAEVSWLRAVHVKADGTLEESEAYHAQLTPGQFLEGRVVLLAQSLGLLVALIGPNLTSRLLNEVWPEVSFNGEDFGTEVRDENTK